MNVTSQRRPSAARHARRGMLVSALALALAGPAQADSVTDWNAIASSPPVVPRFGGPQQQARALAMVQIAVHDALNAIDRRYDTYAIVPAAPANASADAAVAAANYRVLTAFMAASATVTLPGNPCDDPITPALELCSLQYAYDSALAALPASGKAAGIAAGFAAADAILAMRQNDGSATPHAPYTLLAGPGVHQPTPNPEFPAVIVPAFGLWGQVTPFALHSALQFHPDPGEIFDLSGEAYTRDYNEVKQVGNALVRGLASDSAESDIARFWPGGGSNWNLSARGIVNGLGLNQWQHARLFALLNIAETDGLITTMRAKYDYNFWRPVSAIRWADDGNPDTASDTGWRPFLPTPPYPDYPCALPTATGASTEILRRYFGTDDIAFDRSFSAGPVALPPPLAALPSKVINRHFGSLSAAAQEAASARVYAGIHFRSGCDAGVRTGTQVARFIFQHQLRPAK